MKTKMTKTKVLAMVVMIALLAIGSVAQAVITIETVPVGNAGNVGELSGLGAAGFGPNATCGAVNYTYIIGKYEVTAGQYTEFLNAVAASDPYGLYNPEMTTWGPNQGPQAGKPNKTGCQIMRSGSAGSYTYSVASDYANRPVNYVSFWDACRFANWLHNGQGNGDTETSAYTLNGYNGSDGQSILRNPGWKWAVTSEDEWYKAAYYDPNKGGNGIAGYWDYATGSDLNPPPSGHYPGNDMTEITNPGDNANYMAYDWDLGYAVYLDPVHYRTNVGEFELSASAYGTFDQTGNVSEWNEAVVSVGGTPVVASRGIRGGAYRSQQANAGGGSTPLWASNRGYGTPMYENNDTGFRVSSLEITVITLASFTAKASNGRVKLEWVTESELDNAGFNIWRADAADGEYVKLNDEIIPAKGSASNGAKYVFTDNIAKNRMTYFYKLQDIDVYGTSTFHGPVSAMPKWILGILGK